MNRNKQRVNINLPSELVEKSRDLGLNISKTCENALNQAVQNLEQSGVWWARGDLNPRLLAFFKRTLSQASVQSRLDDEPESSRVKKNERYQLIITVHI
jgi:post-segregation antitoxin (ccd killing protein)